MGFYAPLRPTLMLSLIGSATASAASFTDQAASANVENTRSKNGGSAWADYDGDGQLDLFVNSSDGTGTYIYRNQGATFANPVVLPLHTNANNNETRSVITGDLNHDGCLDLARNSYVWVEVLTGDCTGTFTTSHFWYRTNGDFSSGLGDIYLNAEGMALFDKEGDGDLDLLVDNHQGLFILENQLITPTGFGTYDFTRLDAVDTGIPISGDSGDSDYLSIGDTDKDGDLDILARRNNRDDYWINDGDGHFTIQANPAIAGNNNRKGGNVFCDVDDDGDIDAVVAGGVSGSDTNGIWINDGDGTFSTFVDIGVPNTRDISGVDCGDVDRDGDLDIYFGDNGVDYLMINQSSEGNISFYQDNMGINANSNAEGLAFGDYDQDGDLDVFVGETNDSHLWQSDEANGGSPHGDGGDYLLIRPWVPAPNGSATHRIDHGATIRLFDKAGRPLTGARQVSMGKGHGSMTNQSVFMGLETFGGGDEDYILEVCFTDSAGDEVIIRTPVHPTDIAPYQQIDIYSDQPDGDIDNDGVVDQVDNCVFDANPDQADLDGDGIGNICGPAAVWIDDFECNDLDPYGTDATTLAWTPGTTEDSWETDSSGGVSPITDSPGNEAPFSSGAFGEPADAYENMLFVGHPLLNDTIAEVTISDSDDDLKGLVARHSSHDSYYACWWTEHMAPDCDGNGNDMGELAAITRVDTTQSCAGNDYIVTSEAGFDADVSQPYRMRLEVVDDGLGGADITCTIDVDNDGRLGTTGDIVLNYHDANPLPPGRSAMYQYDSGSGGGLIFDDFELQSLDVDSDGDGLSDIIENDLGTPVDDPDADNDMIIDSYETNGGGNVHNEDGDAMDDVMDEDSDGDGIPDIVEAGDLELGTVPPDSDCDGIDDHLDDDSDNDGTPDAVDPCRLVSGTVCNQPPDITSDGGLSTASIEVIDGASAITTVAATDPESLPVTFQVIGGTDAGDVSIDTNTGVLTFNSPANYGSPVDHNGDNVYEILVATFDDQGLYDVQTLLVTVVAGDTDGDGITDADELAGPDGNPNSGDETDPNDADSDDDGILDGTELAGTLGSVTDPNKADTDGDGLTDGLELGLDSPELSSEPLHSGDTAGFVGDADTSSMTDPLDADSDDDGLLDGFEDDDGRLDADETDPNNNDSDGDGIQDGTELGRTTPQSSTEPTHAGDTSNAFQPDQDGSSTTDPLDADSDDDGLLDGTEDANQDGATVNTIGDDTIVSAGETDPNEIDTDGDGIQDGTESGLGSPELSSEPGHAGDTGGAFRPDAQTSTTTDPLDTDSDDGGITDGAEDANGNGRVNGTETDPTDGSDDIIHIDADGDGISNDDELLGPDGRPNTGDETDPNDADSDDDGLLDSTEVLGNGPLSAPTDPNKNDTDGDGLPDGLEAGLEQPESSVLPSHAGDTAPSGFLADADPGSVTDPNDADSDDDGILDGTEDDDGRVDANETDPNLIDTDGDGIQDGTEQGLTTPELSAETGHANDTAPAFQADQDPTSFTDPLDADSDDDGLLDGTEDANQDGATVNTIGDDTIVSSGETDPNDFDTDGDGLSDGVESGLGSPELSSEPGHAGDTGPAFRRDLQPTTTTDPLDTDSDDGGVGDGAEDRNTNGRVNPGELDPNDPSDDATAIDDDGDGLTNAEELDGADGQPNSGDETDPNNPDTDGDGLSDGVEVLAQGSLTAPTDPLDADSDDDGLLDGTEANGTGPLVAPTDPLNPDTDDDGLLDGTEAGLGSPEMSPNAGNAGDTDNNVFVADEDPSTKTDPNHADTDRGTVPDGVEDANQNGRLDPGETNPLIDSDDLYGIDTDGDGLSDGEELDEGTDPNDADSDDDGLLDSTELDEGTNPNHPDTDDDGVGDATELGFIEPEQSTEPGHEDDTVPGSFIPDADPTTQTDPTNPDTDGGSIPDGVEDANGNGLVDPDETDPNDGPDDAFHIDTDGDGLTDGSEMLGKDGQPDSGDETDPLDADSDDDGLLDGTEVFGTGPLTAPTDPNDPDSDDDFLLDGTEVGLTAPEASLVPGHEDDTNPTLFVADSNPNGTTDPNNPDTDGGGVLDGVEDANRNGAFDPGETHPLVTADDPYGIDTDDDGISDGDETDGGTDPTNPDTDGDGLGDGTEVFGTGPLTAPTNPLDADSDDDGLLDGTEALGLLPLAEPTDPNDADSDSDGILDGTEAGLADPQLSTEPLHQGDTTGFVADADPTSTTDPNDPDTDNGGVNDGDEDLDANGAVDLGELDPTDGNDDAYALDTDGDGLSDGDELDGVDGIRGTDDDTDPLDADTDDDGLLDGTEVMAAIPTLPTNADSDGDGLLDGTELGLVSPETSPAPGHGDDTDLDTFVADADPTSVTDPNDRDSDGGGVPDGLEDLDGNGAVDPGELDPTDPVDDATLIDTDGDGLSDAFEMVGPDNISGTDDDTDPNDADSDDDGLLDGTEVTGSGPLMGVVTDPNNADTDGDGIADGTEVGLATPELSNQVAHQGDTTSAFVADADPSSTTDPTDTDTDDGGLLDGIEDTNFNGAVDPGETDPTDGIDDLYFFDDDDDGLSNGDELFGPDGQPNTDDETDPLNPDTDGDGLEDGAEVNVEGTNPLDADTDDDGLLDGSEVDLGTDPLAIDTDNDGILDGTEAGLADPEESVEPEFADDTDLRIFVPDGDPLTVTDPTNPDTDGGGVSDGLEDVDANGILDFGELNPLDPADDATLVDSDGDGLPDSVEIAGFDGVPNNGDETDPNDADTDDDGLLDGTEVFGTGPLTAPTDPNNADTDDDGIQDGTEVGLGNPELSTEPGNANDTDLGIFIPDLETLSTTDPNNPDTDGGSVPDGIEDANGNGAIDAGEGDPNDPADDAGVQDSDFDGLTDAEELDGPDGIPGNGDETDPFNPDTDDDGLTDGDEVLDIGTDPNNPDTDGDDLLDGDEVDGPDGDPSTDDGTGPLDADSDDDGILDGPELTGSIPYGMPTDPNDADSDDDGVGDGTEIGLTEPQTSDNPDHAGDTEPGAFIPDEDSDTTDPNNPDTDGGGVIDGDEDRDGNGAVDPGETDPNDGSDDVFAQDSDDDGLLDIDEDLNSNGVLDPGETDPFDADTDDDGLTDGTELAGDGPLAPWGPTDPNNPDTDGDGLLDGTEVGLTDPTDDTELDIFVPDLDATTTTDPLSDDTDDDGLLDGTEDADGDGTVGPDETDPNLADTDDDGLLDGTEVGLTEPEGDDTGDGFIPDADPTTTTDPLSPDTDDDGLLDGEEDVDVNGKVADDETDPNNPDTDGDDLLDGPEVYEHGTDPLDQDTDDDDLLDGEEVNVFGSNPLGTNRFQGSGCSTTSGGTGGLPLMLAALGLFLRRRRKTLGILLAGTAAATVAPTAQAQEDKPRLDIQRFDPNPQQRTFTLVRDGAQAGKGIWGGMLSVNYGLNPFELSSDEDFRREFGVINHLVGLDLGFEVGATDWFAIGVNLPVLQAGITPNDGLLAQRLGGSGRAVGLGDLALSFGFAPLRESDDHAVSLSVVPRIVVPTGSRGVFLSTGTIGLGVDLALSKRWENFRFGVMAGYNWKAQSQAVSNVYEDDELRYGVGLGVPFRRNTWELGLEVAGGAVLVPQGRDELGGEYFGGVHAPMEMLFAAMHMPEDKGVWTRFGVGPGLTKGWGTPDFRAFVQVGFGKTAIVERAPEPEPIAPAPEPSPKDSDGDGLVDRKDDCPNEPEDKDRYGDDDGCPDPDNDGDGVLDVVDGPRSPDGAVIFDPSTPGFGACMNNPEDPDGFGDEDGCPDPDNDGDGVLDVMDGKRVNGAIAQHPEFPGFGDCMNDPEVRNGVDDDDGCPDESLAAIDEEKGEIVIYDKVYFEVNKADIQRKSEPVLEAVLQILQNYDSVRLVEVQGHTDIRGSASYNKDLSQRRVESVRKWLMERGIDGSRLAAVGYGEEQPVVDARNEAEHAQNRRVQFVILEMDKGGPTVQEK